MSIFDNGTTRKVVLLFFSIAIVVFAGYEIFTGQVEDWLSTLFVTSVTGVFTYFFTKEAQL